MRIIPACAGRTRFIWTQATFTTWDHPRVCGANSLILCRNGDCLFTEKFDSHSRFLSAPATQYSILTIQYAMLSSMINT